MSRYAPLVLLTVALVLFVLCAVLGAAFASDLQSPL